MGTQTEAKFNISSNRKMFKILSSQLYTNKPLAIVRELSCNALDAHITINQSKPFFVNLRNNTFEILDFGPGLSNKQMMEIYPIYGESTKEGNTTETGELGLGSKSPFSYTNKFTITSTQKNISNVYTAFIDDGYPNLKLIDTFTDSSIEHGVRISIPVIPKDMHEFTYAMKKVFKYFPANSYQTEIDIPKRMYNIFPNEDFGITSGTSERPKIIMGPVAYDVDAIKLPEKLQSDFAKILNLKGLELYVPNGSVEVAASRETLSYDDLTINTLTTILEKVKISMVTKVSQKLNESPDYYTAQCNLHRLSSELYALIKGEHITWNNRVIVKTTTVNSLLNNAKIFAQLMNKTLRMKVMKVSWENKIEIHPFNFNYTKPAIIYRDSYKIPFNKTIWFNKDQIKSGTLICRGDLLDLSALCTAFDIDKSKQGSLSGGGVVNLSNLPQIPKRTHISKTSGKKVNRIKKAEQLLDYQVFENYPGWVTNNETVPLVYKNLNSNNYCYIFTHRGAISDNNNININNLLLDFCKSYGDDNLKALSTFQTVGIPATHINVIKSNTIEHVNKRMIKILHQANFNDDFNKLNALGYTDFESTERKYLLKLIIRMSLIKPDILNTSLESKYVNLIKFIRKYNNYTEIISRLDVKPTQNSNIYYDQIETLLIAFEKKYPLIPILSTLGTASYKLSHLEDYFAAKNKMPSAPLMGTTTGSKE